MRHRLMVVFAPISDDEAWRLKLEEQARTAGWRVFHAWGNDEALHDDPDRNTILLANDFDPEVGFRPTRIICLIEDPRTIDRLFRDRLSFGEHSLWRTTRWYADALIPRTAPVSFERIDLKPELELPGLDVISLPGGGPQVETFEPDASGALSMFDDLSRPQASATTWSLDYFDKPGGDDISDWFELFGLRRIFVAGPYFWLPPGTWRVKMPVSIDTEGFDLALRAEWGLSDDYVQAEDVIRKSGRYEIVMDYTWEAPAAANFRLLINRAAFGGRIRLHNCEIIPISEPGARPDTAIFADQPTGMLESTASRKT